jgi:hypothetical protein
MTIRCPEDVPLCCYVTLYTWQHCKKLPVKHSDIGEDFEEFANFDNSTGKLIFYACINLSLVNL